MRINFDAYIEERTRDYSARPWIFDRIGEWLAGHGASRFFLITAEPGGGKTAIAGQVCNASRGLPLQGGAIPVGPGSSAAYHFCSSKDATWIDPFTFSHSVSAQLGMWDRAFAAAQLSAQPELEHIDAKATIEAGTIEAGATAIGNQLIVQAGSAQQTFNREVRTPLKNLFESGFGRGVVILVDALDEALLDGSADTIVDLVALWKSAPAEVRFLLTSRPDPRIVRKLEEQDPHMQRITLSEGEERDESERDVRRYVSAALPATPNIVTNLAPDCPLDAIEQELSRKAEGNFLWAQFAMSMLAAAKTPLTLAALNELPARLDNLYREFLERIAKRDPARWEREHAVVLGTLVVSQEAMTPSQLGTYSRLDLAAVARVMTDIRQLLDARDGATPRYSLYHKSLADFLVDPDKAETHYRDPIEQHRRIVEICRARPDDEYALRNLAAHLFALRADPEARQQLFALVSRARMDAKRQLLGNDAGFANDVFLAAEAAAESRETLVEQIRATAIVTAIRSRAASVPAETLILLARLGDLARVRSYLSLPNTPSLKISVVCDIAKVIADTQPADAEELLRDAIAEAPSEPEADEARAWRALALAHLGRFGDAEPLIAAAGDHRWHMALRFVNAAARALRFDVCDRVIALANNEHSANQLRMEMLAEAARQSREADVIDRLSPDIIDWTVNKLVRDGQYDAAERLASNGGSHMVDSVRQSRIEALVANGDVAAADALTGEGQPAFSFDRAIAEHADPQTIAQFARDIDAVVTRSSQVRRVAIVKRLLDILGERAGATARLHAAEQLLERGEVDAALAITPALAGVIPRLIVRRNLIPVQRLANAFGGREKTRTTVLLLEQGEIDAARPLLDGLTDVTDDEALEIAALLKRGSAFVPRTIRQFAAFDRWNEAAALVSTDADLRELFEAAAARWKLAEAVAAVPNRADADRVLHWMPYDDYRVRVQIEEMRGEDSDWSRQQLAEQWSAFGHFEDALRITEGIKHDSTRLRARANVLVAAARLIDGFDITADEIEIAAERLINLRKFDAAMELARHLTNRRNIACRLAEKGEADRAVQLTQSEAMTRWRTDSQLGQIAAAVAPFDHEAALRVAQRIHWGEQRARAFAAVARAALAAGVPGRANLLAEQRDVEISIHALTTIATGYADAGLMTEARGTLDAALRLVDAVEDDYARNAALYELSLAMTGQGSFSEAIALAKLVPLNDRYRTLALLAVAREQMRAGNVAAMKETLGHAPPRGSDPEIQAMFLPTMSRREQRRIILFMNEMPNFIRLVSLAAAEPWWMPRSRIPPVRWWKRWRRRRGALRLAGIAQRNVRKENDRAALAVQFALLGKENIARRLADEALSSAPRRIPILAYSARVYALINDRSRALALAAQAIDELMHAGELQQFVEPFARMLASLDMPDELIEVLIREASLRPDVAHDLVAIVSDSIDRDAGRASRAGNALSRAASESMPSFAVHLCWPLLRCAEISRDPSFVREAFALASRLNDRDAAQMLPGLARQLAQLRDPSAEAWIERALMTLDGNALPHLVAQNRAIIAVALLRIDKGDRAREQMRIALAEARNASRTTFFAVLREVVAGANKEILPRLAAAIAETEQWWEHRSMEWSL